MRAQELITDNHGGLLAGTVQARWPARSQEHGTEVFCRLKRCLLCWCRIKAETWSTNVSTEAIWAEVVVGQTRPWHHLMPVVSRSQRVNHCSWSRSLRRQATPLQCNRSSSPFRGERVSRTTTLFQPLIGVVSVGHNSHAALGAAGGSHSPQYTHRQARESDRHCE